jgi:hypothetical protein
VDFQHFHARIEIVGSQMRISHGHLQCLVAKPHLDTANINAAANKAGSAGVTQNMRYDLIVGAQTDFHLGVIPDLTKPDLIEHRKRPFEPLMRNLRRLSRTAGEGDCSASIGFGEPEGDAMVLQIIPRQSNGFAKTAA